MKKFRWSNGLIKLMIGNSAPEINVLSETYLEINKVVHQTKTIIINHQYETEINNPAVGAAALPPLNLKNTGQQ